VFTGLSGAAVLVFIGVMIGLTQGDAGLDKIYTSLLTLLGTMVGYYFGGARAASSGHEADE
jgi:hypothetical protein